MMSGYLFITGLLMVASPVVILFKDGVLEDEDFIQWLMHNPLERGMALRFSLVFGIGLIGLAGMLSALP